MKRTYDFNKISIETGFNPVQIEKVCRISDILENISSVPFMRKRLALYGGTALAFVHFEEIERLSVARARALMITLRALLMQADKRIRKRE